VKKEVFAPELSDFKALALLALEKGSGGGARIFEYVWDGDVLAASCGTRNVLARRRSGAAQSGAEKPASRGAASTSTSRARSLPCSRRRPARSSPW
jgi:hypothetical protein